MKSPRRFTIAFKVISITNQIEAHCKEFDLTATGNSLTQAIEALQQKIDDVVIEMSDSGWEHGNFIRQCYGGDDEEGFDDWLGQKRYQRSVRRLEDAFRKAYPVVKDVEFLMFKIPGIDWDDSPNYDRWLESQREAYEGLIADGADNQNWVRFVQAICAAKYQSWAEWQRSEVYEGWKAIGLPVLSEDEMMALSWDAIEALAFGGKNGA